jgi:hypothetical protein
MRAVVNCRLCELAIALELLVVPICKWSINSSICNIYSLKMQPFSLFYTVISTLHVSATHRHLQVWFR